MSDFRLQLRLVLTPPKAGDGEPFTFRGKPYRHHPRRRVHRAAFLEFERLNARRIDDVCRRVWADAFAPQGDHHV